MSVIVKGMEMPNSCASCRMAVCFADTGRAKYYATLSYIDPERGKRSYDCPLRPLPEKHGRLGDLDEIMDKLAKDKRKAFTKHDVWLMLSRYGAETIVEAEGDG